MILSYTVPTEPSSKRVLVWRHLRKLGAILYDGLWLVPATPTLEKGLREAYKEVQELGGHAIAFYANDLTPEQTQELSAAYNNARREEYLELLQRCERFQAHVQRLTEDGDFKFGAVEELEEDLEKRRRSLTQIIGRDFFEIAERKQVETCIRDCEAALAQFVERAYLVG